MKYGKQIIKPLLVGLAVIGLCMATASQVHRYRQTYAEASARRHIIVDAGHGGEDGGASSQTGVKESLLNLEISLRVTDLLAFCGLAPVPVRQTDASVYSAGCGSIAEKKVSDLRNRTALVNATPDALLLSIHQNYFPQEQYHGAQVFYAKTPGSQALAERLQSALRETLDPENRRQAKQSQSVYLMEHIACTGVLIECGFLSNEAETARLQQSGYQKRLASAICGALMQYLQEEGNTDEI